MKTLADIFRMHGSDYLNRYGKRILPSHRKVIRDVILCRTKHLGGCTWFCEHCRQYHYSYHSCKNRSCPQCQNQKADVWLDKQQDNLLPVEYFMATFTLPEGLRCVSRSNQKTVYTIFFHASAQALQKLALDPKYLGGKIGMVGVLQTWTRSLDYHPHIHYLIPGGALSPDDKTWIPAKNTFLMHNKPLSIIFRAKVKDALKKSGLFKHVSPQVWQHNWVVHIEPVGNGRAVLKYLAPYIFRIAISNRNILGCKDGQVTFRYKDSDAGQFKTITLNALEFMRRYLQHVLPRGFQKVRYYGFLMSKKKKQLTEIKHLLSVQEVKTEKTAAKEFIFTCPKCGRNMILIEQSNRMRGPPLEEILFHRKLRETA